MGSAGAIADQSACASRSTDTCGAPREAPSAQAKISGVVMIGFESAGDLRYAQSDERDERADDADDEAVVENLRGALRRTAAHVDICR